MVTKYLGGYVHLEHREWWVGRICYMGGVATSYDQKGNILWRKSSVNVVLTYPDERSIFRKFLDWLKEKNNS
jgi:hypothetical protein